MMLNKDAFTFHAELVIKGLQAALIRVQFNLMEVGEQGSLAPNMSFNIQQGKYNKVDFERTGVISNVNLFGMFNNTPAYINHNISTEAVFTNSEYLVVRIVLTNSTLVKSGTAKNATFANHVMVMTAGESKDNANYSSGIVIQQNTTVANLAKPLSLTTPLSFEQMRRATVINRCVSYSNATSKWIVNECTNVTIAKMPVDQAICCSYFNTQFIDTLKLSADMETAEEQAEEVTSFLAPVLIVFGILIAAAVFYKVVVARKGNKLVEEHEELPQETSEEKTVTLDNTVTPMTV
jgi:hypothetical protein